jgi:diacylglycerol kinase family enzyme
MQVNKVAIIFNPKGGSAKKGALAGLKREFESRGIEVVILPTEAEMGSATKLARQAHDMRCDLVVAVGGDGTVCGVAEGLMGTNTPMATFPGGTGNLFARAFYAVPKQKQFVNMVLSGEPQAVDMVKLQYNDTQGKNHDRVFLVAVGLGKVSDAISGASPMFKRLFGKLAYVFKVTLACLNPRAKRFEFKARGAAKAEEAAAVFVLNVTPPSMAMMSRGCNASDGYLDVAVFQATNALQLIGVAACLAFGRPERSKYYRTLRTREITIRSDSPVTPNIDGDAGSPTTELTMRALPGAVKMVLAA